MRRLRTPWLLAITLCLLGTVAALTGGIGQREASGPCQLASKKPLARIKEASGLTLSRRTSGVLWTHNDSGQPMLYAVDTSGAPRGRVRVSNATVVDWEDVTAARCPSGDCLYIADIGDNDRSRSAITVYRIPEPQPADAQSAAPEVFSVTYPDGAHDAEALFVVDENLFVITKDDAGILYRISQSHPGTVKAERIGELGIPRVTDADVSADGKLVVVRTNNEVAFYPTAALVAGKSTKPDLRFSVRQAKEPQGEGVAFDGNRTLYLTSEGSGGGQLSALTCALPG
jgi:hypothetical protein